VASTLLPAAADFLALAMQDNLKLYFRVDNYNPIIIYPFLLLNIYASNVTNTVFFVAGVWLIVYFCSDPVCSVYFTEE